MNQKIEHKRLKVELVFNDSAKDAFQFPIRNSIRISFWLTDVDYSTPSEITFDKESVNVNEKIEACILIINVFNTIKEGNSFYIGTFPLIIGKGIIKEIED